MSARNRAMTHPGHPAPPANATALVWMSVVLVGMLVAPAALAQGGVRASGDVETEGQLISTAASGAPLAVASSEVVSNLNADLLDGNEAADFATASTVAGLEATIAQLEALVSRLHPRLDLGNSRFRATVTFDDGGELQPASAVPLVGVPEAGYFYFTRDFYADVYVAMLDGRGVNGHWWVFTAPLTDLGYTLRIEDVETGAVKTYAKVANTRPSIQDTFAFPDSGGGFALRAPAVASAGPRAASGAVTPATAAALASCVEDVDTVCLVADRFAVEVEWDSGVSGGNGSRSEELATSHTGAFWFFTPSDVGLVAKIVETPAAFVVNIGALTDLDYTVTVTDTCTGTFETYDNTSGSPMNFVDDTTFPNEECVP